MNGDCVVHTPDAIAELLRRGLTPITDNRDALVTLGFERAYPQARGYDSTIWQRELQVETQRGRRFARERAILEGL